jgi:hypothetical protein
MGGPETIRDGETDLLTFIIRFIIIGSLFRSLEHEQTLVGELAKCYKTTDLPRVLTFMVIESLVRTLEDEQTLVGELASSRR